MKKDFTIVIPARLGSKGIPFKNRKLCSYTLESIPHEYRDKVIINTDDDFLIQNCLVTGLKYYKRPENLGLDTTSTKDVMVDMVNNYGLSGVIITLYLTYPQRTWDDIINAYHFFNKKKSKSLLCKKEIKGTHPYLYMLEKDNNMGEQLVKHNLYRRQDYPKVFEISHFISIFKSDELINLNNNLYNENTIFYNINEKIDIDNEEDFINFIKNG
jgi:CMP-N,N'-diacetyllegionaminic acid synthase